MEERPEIAIQPKHSSDKLNLNLINYKGYNRIGNKGFIGSLGIWGNGENCGAFWEYSFTSNTWTQKACFPGTGLSNVSTFSIGSKGYVVAGNINDDA